MSASRSSCPPGKGSPTSSRADRSDRDGSAAGSPTATAAVATGSANGHVGRPPDPPANASSAATDTAITPTCPQPRPLVWYSPGRTSPEIYGDVAKVTVTVLKPKAFN